MVGIKLVSGEPTGELCMTYFVREKRPLKELSSKLRIPNRITAGDISVHTDVIEWPKMDEQALDAIIHDGRRQGTLSCFAASRFGSFGVSCAHCLIGADQNGARPSPVDMYVTESGRWKSAGRSVTCLYGSGHRRPGNFGYMDCGLFSLDDPDLRRRAQRAQELEVVTHDRSLHGETLFAASTLDALGAPGASRSAKVVGIDKIALDEAADLVLQVDPPGTFQGDSGMMWLTSSGRAAAIHARGEVRPSGIGSRLTTAMSAARAAAALDVRFMMG